MTPPLTQIDAHRPASRPARPSSSGRAAARAHWSAPHDPTLRERLEVAAAHLRLARLAAGGGVPTWILRREVELAGREVLIARRTLRNARHEGSPRGHAQSRVLEAVARAAAELQRSTRTVSRLLDEPLTLSR